MPKSSFSSQLERISSLVWDKRYIIIILSLIPFTIFTLLKKTVLTRLLSITPSVMEPLSRGFNPVGIGLYIFTFLVFILIIPRIVDSRKIVKISAIIMMALLIHTSVYLIQPDIWQEWKDAEGYYELGLYAAESGVINFLQEYHSINTEFPERMYAEIIGSLEILKYVGLYDWAKQKLSYSIGVRNPSQERQVVQPPMFPILLSIFLRFWPSRFASVVFTWMVSVLLVLVFYFFIKRYADEKTSFYLTLLFMTVPSLNFITNEANIDVVMGAFLLLSTYFYLRGLEENRIVFMLFSGLFFSLSFLTKFISAIIIIPYIILLGLKLNKRKEMRKRYILGGILFIVMFLIPLLLMTQFGYYAFLNILTSKAFASFTQRLHVGGRPWVVDLIFQPVYTLFWWGIPIMLLMFIVIIGLFRTPKDWTWEVWLFFSFLIIFALVHWHIMFLPPMRTGMPFLGFLFVGIAPLFRKLKVDINYILIGIAVHLYQLVVFMV